MKRIIITNLDFAIKNGVTFFELATLENKINGLQEIRKRIKSSSGYFNLVVACVYPDGQLEYSYFFEKNPF